MNANTTINVSIAAANAIKTVKNSKVPLVELKERRRRGLKSSLRLLLCEHFGWNEEDNEDDLNYLLLNAVSNKGRFKDLRDQVFKATQEPEIDELQIDDRIEKRKRPGITPAMKRKFVDVYEEIKDKHPEVNDTVLKKRLCTGFRQHHLCETIRPDYNI